MKKVVSLFVLAALPLCSQLSHATATIQALVNGAAVGYSCTGCSPAQMQNLAASKGRGTWYVYNLSANIINQYVVTCEPIAGGLSCYADLGTVPADIAKYFSTYQGLWNWNGKNEAFSTSVTISVLSTPGGGPLNAQGMHVDDGYVNAYDTLQYSALGNGIIAMLNNPSTYSGLYAQVVQLVSPLDPPVIKLDKIQATVTVVFHDKSKRTYQFNKDTETYAPIDNTAIDSSGNTIPEKKPRNGAGFFGDPQHPYNLPNIITILNADPPTFKDEVCLEEVWTDDDKGGGGTLNCVKSP